MLYLQTRKYPWDLPKMGQAYIINNIASTNPGSMVDVHQLQITFETMKFEVQIHTDCTKNASSVKLCIHFYKG